MSFKKIVMFAVIAVLTGAYQQVSSFAGQVVAQYQDIEPAAVPTEVPTDVVSSEVELLGVEVLSVRPHDTNAFTQGLLVYDGMLYESTGQYGNSSLRLVEPQTGEVQRQVNLVERLFAEGLALVDDHLIQITWQNGYALQFDRDTFELLDVFTYAGEGWGLCYDGEQLIMSDGSPTLTMRDPQTFEIISQVTVTRADVPVEELNELECVEDVVYANIWQTDSIVRIDKATGIVTAHIDASGLLTPDEAANANVLNGIAYQPDTGTFLITGKLWPKMFEVNFVPVTP